MDPLAQLDQLAPRSAGVVAGITPAELDRPTPCADFTVRGVLEHMIGGATVFAAAYRGTTPAEPDASDPLAEFGPALGDLAAAITAPGALDRTVAAPFGEVAGETFARFVVLDGLVHGWDLATATGQPYDPPDRLVDAADAFARRRSTRCATASTFGAAVPAARIRDSNPTARGLHRSPDPGGIMTTTLTPTDLDELKTKQQATWASGNYGIIGTTLQLVGEELCEAVDVAAGSQVLDVAAGNGNASLAAARRGADVTCSDYVARCSRRRSGAPTPKACRSPPSRRRRGPPVRRRQLRHRALDLRGDVHAQPRALGSRAGARVQAGRPHRPRQLDARGLHRPDVQLVGAHVPPPAGVPSPLLWGTEARAGRAARRRLHDRDHARSTSCSGTGRPTTSSTRSSPTTGRR